MNVCAVKRGRFSLFDNFPYFANYVLNCKNSTFLSKNGGKNLRISKNSSTFALGKQKQLTIKTITIMKTMSEQECIDFVKSGFIPTNNNDISDLQDCFNRQSVDFFVGLILDDETRYKAEKLMRACLLDGEMVDYIIKKANEVKKIIERRNKYEMDIYSYEQSINMMKDYIAETNNIYERYIKK